MNKKILVVEANYAGNNLPSTLLKAGYTLIGTALSAEKAEQLLMDQKPDLVILNIELKVNAFSKLAQRLYEQDITFIYLLENPNQQIMAEAKRFGPFDFLLKPFRDEDLILRLDLALMRHREALRLQLEQETRLRRQTTNIIEEVPDDTIRLLKIATLLVELIPFDLIVLDGEANSPNLPNTFGYLRIGFDEYQLITEQELSNVGGRSQSMISRAIKESNQLKNLSEEDNSSVLNPSITPVQRIWIDSFEMSSSIKATILNAQGLRMNFCLHSREPLKYNKKHLNLLTIFKNCFFPADSERIYTKNKKSKLKTKDPIPTIDQKHCRQEFKGIIGHHPLLTAALELTAQVAPYNTSVLILGESGTGKEKIARGIHDLSSRKNKPFIEINCGAIPSSLIESELFGHEKGAFTGATERRIGRFEQADGGTVFLDEIGELPLDMQVKLLRVLQEKEINYVGSNSAKKVDIRIVAATNRNLDKEVVIGNFRLDLYYRLNVFPITLPPLRDRKSDIVSLVTFFAQKFCAEFHKPYHGISSLMIETMLNYQWPGNIRELENVLERSVILYNGNSELQLMQHLTGSVTEKSDTSDIGTLQNVKDIQRSTERTYIVSVLRKTDGRIRGNNGAAELLNLKPTTLESKIAKLGISKDDYAK